MAYSPVDHGRLIENRAVKDMAADKGVTPAQLALAWVLRMPQVSRWRRPQPGRT
jgi:diketogulonate reductase-like aldo/keto reductase